MGARQIVGYTTAGSLCAPDTLCVDLTRMEGVQLQAPDFKSGVVD